MVIEAGQSVYEAIVTLFLEDQGTLFVVNSSGELGGVVSRKDLLKVSLGSNDLQSVPVEMVMTRFAQTVWVEEGDTLLAGINKLQASHVNCLPVLKSLDSKIPTGRFDLDIVLKILAEMVEGKFEEGLYND